MPKVAEAAVLVAGQVIDVQQSTNFDTKQPDGLRVLISTGDGFASVKLSAERALEVQPSVGGFAAWYLRYGATGGGDRQATSYASFVREMNPGDLDRLVSFAGSKK